MIVAVWMQVILYWVAWCNNISSIFYDTETRRVNKISSRLGHDAFSLLLVTFRMKIKSAG